MQYYKGLFVIVFLFFGCSYRGIYKVNLQSVEKSNFVQTQSNSIKIINRNKYGLINSIYEDKKIKIMWKYKSKALQFVLRNKTAQTIKIIWDDIVYVDQNGACSGVINYDIKYSEKNRSQLPSLVLKNSYLKNALIPKKNIKFDTQWLIKSLLFDISQDKEELNKYVKVNIGKTIKIFFPILIQNKRFDYFFVFKISDFRLLGNR